MADIDYQGSFHYVDYIVLGGMLLISLVIGVYYAYVARRQKSFKEYFTASGNMSVFPTAISLVASVLCSVWYIGVPAEVYNYGAHFVYDFPTSVLAICLTAYGTLPVFYELKLTSSNEYLGKRFGQRIRLAGSALYLVNTLIYVSLVMFIPAMSISQVTGLHLWISLSAMCVVGTVYTALGGIRAVMWTDVFQMLIIYASLLAVCVKGTLDVGGIDIVFERAVEGKRIALAELKPDPKIRYTFFIIIICCFLYWSGLYCTSQTQVQRYVSCPTLKSAQCALWLNIPAFWFVEAIILYIGLVLYATYWDCDPVTNNEIKSGDQILTYHVLRTFGSIPGLPGLFVSGVFSGALSTISSSLNSMAAVTMEDFVVLIPKYQSMSDSRATKFSRWIAFSYGMLTMLMMLIIEKIESVVGFYAYNLGAVQGVLLGVFILGMFVPWSNSLGAGLGLAVSLVFGLTLGIGCQMSGTHFKTETHSVKGCSNYTDLEWKTTFNRTSEYVDANIDPPNDVSEIFKWSPYIMEPITFMTVLIVGGIGSLFSGNKKFVDRKLLSPIIRGFVKTDKFSSSRKIRLGESEVERNQLIDPKMGNARQYKKIIDKDSQC